MQAPGGRKRARGEELDVDGMGVVALRAALRDRGRPTWLARPYDIHEFQSYSFTQVWCSMSACRYQDNLVGESCRSRAICEAVREERPDGWGSYPRIAVNRNCSRQATLACREKCYASLPLPANGFACITWLARLCQQLVEISVAIWECHSDISMIERRRRNALRS